MHIDFKFGFQFLGERTFGVLTKIDLMDQGTNAVEVSCFQIHRQEESGKKKNFKWTIPVCF